MHGVGIGATTGAARLRSGAAGPAMAGPVFGGRLPRSPEC